VSPISSIDRLLLDCGLYAQDRLVATPIDELLYISVVSRLTSNKSKRNIGGEREEDGGLLLSNQLWFGFHQ
jgi:hypothetical protein